MEFGSVSSYSELLTKDFILNNPQQAVLSGIKSPLAKMHIGLPKWGYEKLNGFLSDTIIKSNQALNIYSKKFTAVELNATHYKIYSKGGFNKWKEETEEGFIFCPKLYQGITHRGPLKNKLDILDEFLEGVIALENKLGPIFVQVADKYAPTQLDDLTFFLSRLPKDLLFFLELRHPDWFNTKQNSSIIFQLLKDLKIGAVITDTPGRRDCAHLHLTVPQAFVRFVCDGGEELDMIRIMNWKQILKQWFDNGLEAAYFFLHIRNERNTKDFASYVKDEFSGLTNLH